MRKIKNIVLGLTFVFLILLSANPSFAQLTDSTDFYFKKYGRCWFGKVRQHLALQKDTTAPSALNKTTEEDADDGRTYIIPVVFHIIHNGGNENIPDDYIYKQVEDLNRDYKTTGTYKGAPAGVDTKIRFCLAKSDPDGQPSNGIVRIKSSFTELKSSGSDELNTKNLSRWDPKRYLNFWVVKNIDGNDSISGYSYLASEAANNKYDGIVLNFRFVGSNNRFGPVSYKLGKTASHEVGHYLELYHTFGKDDDNKPKCTDDDDVYDTPICDGLYFAGPPLCKEPFQCGNNRMVENHMDYSKDACATLFTKGQTDRMRSALRKYRPSLVNYPNILLIECDSIYNQQNPISENKFEIHPNPAYNKINIFPRFREKLSLSINIYDNLGRHIKDIEGIETVTELITIDLTDFRPGMYHFIIKTNEEVVQKKIVILGGK